MKQVTGVRPRPFVLEDTEFWWSAAAAERLLIQRCVGCRTLRHPPAPSCASCRSLDWDTVTASGRGTVHSFVISHYPQHPAFSYPLAVVLVDLEEGTRLVAAFQGSPDEVRIGLPVMVDWITDEAGTVLPVFVAAEGPR
ncbi:Zn-ribbon domain-containing OB-fold protein [Nocardioides sp. Bht2]|uniref:Zn-ribbon domain-containing OB-fold protein n=1 Tax=Nocardioides sp. Bht2 TaxID=3392297 RepID=UPI0039B693CA